MLRSLPAMVEANRRVPRGIAGYWRIIRQRDAAGPWTISDIADRTNVHRTCVREYVVGLVKTSIAEIVADEPAHLAGRRHRFRLVRRPMDSPRVAEDGRERLEPITDSFWRCLKMLKTFTPRELAEAAPTPERQVSLSHARNYVCRLKRAGIVAVAVKRGENVEARYRLAVNLGARGPKILFDRSVFDPNSGKVLPVLEGGRNGPLPALRGAR